MLIISLGKSFKKSRKRLLKSGNFDDSSLKLVIAALAGNLVLDQKYRDHELKGDWSGYRECHISSDVLLIYKVWQDEITLSHIGTHSQLFGR